MDEPVNYYRITYNVRKTLVNIKDHFKIHLLTAVTVGVTLTIFGLYLLIHTNLKGLAQQWGEKIQVIAYVDKSLIQDAQMAIQARIRAIPAVEKVTYRSPAQALESLKHSLGETEGILEGIDENPLPPTFEIQIKKDAYGVKVLEDVAHAIRREQGITDVQYGGAWIERFLAILRILHILGISLGILLLIATVAIISNTLKLAFYTRKDEIEIMRLVGATEAFINFPMRLEAMIQGGVGALIALGVLWVLYKVFTMEFRQFWGHAGGWNTPVFLDPLAMAGLVLLGLVLGLAGSFFPLGKTSEDS